MFCPKCGNADQTPETYCRRCGTFLPDLDKPTKKQQTPEEHLKANFVLNLMTIVVSFSLAIALYAIFLGRNDTHWVIYLTAGFLIAIGAWQIQTLWRTILLKRHFKKNKATQKAVLETSVTTAGKLLDRADLENVVPASVTDHTTKHLIDPQKRSS